MMPNLDATGHQWVGTLALFQFELEYQKGADNGTTDVLSQVPISHSRETVQSLLEVAIVGVANWGEVRVREELLEKHERLSQEVRVQAAKLAPMHIVDWEEAQEADAALAVCCKWLCLMRDTPLLKWDALLKECLGVEAETEQGKTFFHIHNSLILNKGLMYMSTTPKGETEGVLTFVVPVGQHCMALEGEVPKAPLCPIRAYAPLELVHLDYPSIESTMELNKSPVVKNILMITDHFMRYALAVVMKDQTAKTVTKVFYKHFIAVFGVPAKLLSHRGVNFTSAVVEELCAAFGIQKC